MEKNSITASQNSKLAVSYRSSSQDFQRKEVEYGRSLKLYEGKENVTCFADVTPTTEILWEKFEAQAEKLTVYIEYSKFSNFRKVSKRTKKTFR